MGALFQGLLFVHLVFKLAKEKNWDTDKYIEECHCWVTILLSLIDFSHHDAPTCINQVTHYKEPLEHLSRYVNKEVRMCVSMAQQFHSYF